MANTTISPNMGLIIPTVGVDPGPDWANNINSSLSNLDQHDHSPGKGIQVTPNGLNINSDLTLQTNNLINVKSVRYTSNVAPLAAVSPNLQCLYVSGVDLYFNDGSGNQVRMTQNGSVSGSAGTITGLPSGTASAAFNAVSGTFVFQQATNTAANIDAATLIVRYPGSYPVPAGNYISIQAPSTLSTGYSFTLPTAQAAANNSLMVSSSTGQMSYVTVDPNTFLISGGVLQLVLGFGLTPSGAILSFGGTVAPAGYLLCDGTSYLRASYPALFAAIGTAYGSTDGAHFNVPDMRGAFLRGVSGTSGIDPDANTRVASRVGANSGNNVGSEQSYALQSHFHDTYFDANGAADPLKTPQFYSTYQQNSVTVTRLRSYPTTSTGGAETRPYNIYVNYIIKI